MSHDRIPQRKINALRRLFIAGNLNGRQMEVKMKLGHSTASNYLDKFKQIRELYPEKLADMKFYLPVKSKEKILPERYNELIKALPALVAADTHKQLRPTYLWRAYYTAHPGGYTQAHFNLVYSKWRKANQISVYATSKIKAIRPEDALVLAEWRNSNDHQKWQKAVVIQGSYQGWSVTELVDQTELALETVEKWLAIYKNKGIAGLYRKPLVFNEEIREFLKHKRDCLMELIHQKPKMHGFNRTTLALAIS